MKKHILLVVLVFEFIYPIFAQNFQTVNNNRIMFFSNNGNYESIHIDSIENMYDVIMYPNSIVRASDNSCYSPNKPSRIGEKVILKNDGMNLFFNQYFDTIFIKTTASLNENWIAYRSQTLIVRATVVSKTYQEFLGVLDSVKSISFQAYDLNMNLVNSSINQYELQISKNNGLIQFFDFYTFPDIPENEILYTSGISNPQLGIQNFTWFETYDFEPEDELHIYEFDRHLQFPPNSYTEIKTIFKYLSKNVYLDSIVYLVDREKLEISSSIDINSLYTHDTISQTVVKNISFDQIQPGEPYILNDDIYFYRLVNSTIKQISSNPDYFGPAPCYTLDFFNICSYTIEYQKGLGGPYFGCACNEYRMERSLVYYNKNGVTFGTPFNLSKINDNPNLDNYFSLFPNPLEQYLTVSTELNGVFLLECFDIFGKQVFSEIISNSEQTINISFLKSGMYIFQISSKVGIIQTNKLIKI